MSLVNTIQLLHQCGQGDTLAIEQLVNEFHPTIYRLACSILDDPDDADEAAQDALLATLKASASYRGEAALTTWLYTITVNICRDRLRKRRTRERLTQTMHTLARLVGGHSASPEDESIRSEGMAAIRQAVNALGEKQRIPIILRYYHDRSVAEIAEILGINEGTVCSRLSIGREQLRVRLKDKSKGEQP
jgi:RNA polymerase sigma-70 factor (ECF subfamily)